MIQITKNIFSLLKVAILLSFIFLGSSFSYAASPWTPPTDVFPLNNSEAPVNIGPSWQKKIDENGNLDGGIESKYFKSVLSRNEASYSSNYLIVKGKLCFGPNGGTNGWLGDIGPVLDLFANGNEQYFTCITSWPTGGT